MVWQLSDIPSILGSLEVRMPVPILWDFRSRTPGLLSGL